MEAPVAAVAFALDLVLPLFSLLLLLLLLLLSLLAAAVTAASRVGRIACQNWRFCNHSFVSSVIAAAGGQSLLFVPLAVTFFAFHHPAAAGW